MNEELVKCDGFVQIKLTTDLYKINTFDDGNDKYRNYKNEYYKIGYYLNYPGKIALMNIDKETIISSISSWKVSSIK